MRWPRPRPRQQQATSKAHNAMPVDISMRWPRPRPRPPPPHPTPVPPPGCARAGPVTNRAAPEEIRGSTVGRLVSLSCVGVGVSRSLEEYSSARATDKSPDQSGLCALAPSTRPRSRRYFSLPDIRPSSMCRRSAAHRKPPKLHRACSHGSWHRGRVDLMMRSRDRPAQRQRQHETRHHDHELAAQKWHGNRRSWNDNT